MDQDTNSGNTGGESRPDVLNAMSETQMMELERAFTDSTTGYFDELAHSYGWSDADTEAVRRHFAERVQGGGSASSGGSGNQSGQQ